ncbi:MAG: hypothetical protein IKY79_09255 [Bacteroidales bacterium]|nr:hypothetical protein [Bacteroidales bacterium]
MEEKINKFWEWFEANNERLTMLSEYTAEEKRKLFDELQAALDEYCQGLTFEIGDQTKNGRQLVISADGDVELFRHVVELVENAPDLDWWEFIPFKQPNGNDLKVYFGKFSYETKKMYFQQLENEEEPDILGIRVAVDGVVTDDEDFLVGVYVTLEAMIGEFDCATLLGYLEAIPVPANPAKEGFRPLTDFPDFIEWFKAERDK